jgi:hypothetical protein
MHLFSRTSNEFLTQHRGRERERDDPAPRERKRERKKEKRPGRTLLKNNQ